MLLVEITALLPLHRDPIDPLDRPGPRDPRRDNPHWVPVRGRQGRVVHLERQDDVFVRVQSARERNRGPIPGVVLAGDSVGRESHVGIPTFSVLALGEVELDTGSAQDVSEARPAPAAVHDRAVEPVEALDFCELGPHRVASVSGTLERADDGVLGVVGGQGGDG
ncbi:hypothetical protein M8818_003796 [Zalaria obscura]|uniref:Uncharacterized protein n=1 Tax=Zalaria obscura TaxID=2024903 RepID=A0ACC3SDX3_9PEZI